MPMCDWSSDVCLFRSGWVARVWEERFRQGSGRRRRLQSVRASGGQTCQVGYCPWGHKDPSNEHPGLISFRMGLLAVQGTLKSLLQHHSSKASILLRSAFFIVQLSHPYMTTGVGGTSLVAQWLRLLAPDVGDPGRISGQGTRSRVLQLSVQM